MVEKKGKEGFGGVLSRGPGEFGFSGCLLFDCRLEGKFCILFVYAQVS